MSRRWALVSRRRHRDRIGRKQQIDPPQGAMWLAFPTRDTARSCRALAAIRRIERRRPAGCCERRRPRPRPPVFRFLDRGLRGRLITTCPMRCAVDEAMPAASPQLYLRPYVDRAWLDATHVLRQAENSCRRRPGGPARTISSAQVAASLAGRPTRAGIGGEALEMGRRQACDGAVGAASDFTARVPPGETCRTLPRERRLKQRLQAPGMIRSPSDGSDLEEDEKLRLLFFPRFGCSTARTENETPAQIRIIGHYKTRSGTSDAASQGYISLS